MAKRRSSSSKRRPRKSRTSRRNLLKFIKLPKVSQKSFRRLKSTSVLVPLSLTFLLLGLILYGLFDSQSQEHRVKLILVDGPNVSPEIGTRHYLKFNNGNNPYAHHYLSLDPVEQVPLYYELTTVGYSLNILAAAIDIYEIPLRSQDVYTTPYIPGTEKGALNKLENYKLVYSSKEGSDRFIIGPSEKTQDGVRIGGRTLQFLTPVDSFGFSIDERVTTRVSVPSEGILVYDFERRGKALDNIPFTTVSAGIGPSGRAGETIGDVLTKDWTFVILTSSDIGIWSCLDEFVNSSPIEVIMEFCYEKDTLVPPDDEGNFLKLVVLSRPDYEDDFPSVPIAILEVSSVLTDAHLQVRAVPKEDEPLLRWLPAIPFSEDVKFSEFESVGLPGNLTIGVNEYEVKIGDEIHIIPDNPDESSLSTGNDIRDIIGMYEIVEGYYIDVETSSAKVLKNGVELGDSPLSLVFLRDPVWQAIGAIAAIISTIFAFYSLKK